MAKSNPSSNSDDPEKEIEVFGKLSLEVQKRRPMLGLVGKQKSWSELPWELVIQILQRLQSYQDFVCATSSCSFWRLIGTKFNDIFGGGYQFPWLMLPAEEDNNLRGFYNVRKNITCYLDLPQANGKKRCVSWQGWLVTVDSTLEINVVHPLFRWIQIKLPDISASLDLHLYGFDPVASYYDVVEKAAFSSSPGKTSQDYTLSILFAGGRVALWRKGDACWKEMDQKGIVFTDIVFHKERFYAICRPCIIYTWDTEGTPIQALANIPIVGKYPFILKMYLVESGGSLLIVLRHSDPEDVEPEDMEANVERSNKFQVFEVSTYTTWRQVSDLDGRALFLGFNSSFSIDASDFPGCKPNCIYFTDDYHEGYFELALGGGKDMGIYHLEDGHFERFPVTSFCNISPPFWVELTI